MDETFRTVLISGGFTILGALIGFGGSLLVAWCQARHARELSKYNDSLERRRERDREEREHKWELQRMEAIGRRKPALRLVFDPKSGTCLYPLEFELPSAVPGRSARNVSSIRTQTVTNWYVSILARNEGGSTARNCQGYLKSIERREEGGWTEKPIHGPLSLIWAYGPHDAELAVGFDRPLNILVFRSGPTAQFQLQIQGGEPEPVTRACSELGEYRFTVAVTADDTEPAEIQLAIKWDTSWKGEWTDKHIWVEESGASLSQGT